MTGRLAIDFGTSNTILALWDEMTQQASAYHLESFGKRVFTGEQSVSIIPSVIHYGENSQKWIGQQVMDRGLYASPYTLRWMKRYISTRSPLKIMRAGQEITPSTAGQDFVGTLLGFAIQELGIQDEEIAFTVPVEAYEHYEDWLSRISFQIGAPRFRLIDEPSAAALGYGIHIQPGRVLLIFDFGGGTMDVSVVMIEDDQTRQVGRRCRVLGKSGLAVGGATLDQWIYQEALKRWGLAANSAAAAAISNALLVACEQAKETLTQTTHAAISMQNPESHADLEWQLSREDFEAILEEHELFTSIHQTIRHALNAAYERGFTEDHISEVLLIGGSSQIPAVIHTLKRMFGKDKVKTHRPLDAVATGAAAFVSGVGFYDHIQHDYAIRYINPDTGEHEYLDIVKKGTPYPTASPIARLTIKAAYDGQQYMGLAIFERGLSSLPQSGSVELVFDPNGAAKMVPVTPQEVEERALFWMNENRPTFLQPTPPVARGQAYFDVQFFVDERKQLTLTARDLVTGRRVLSRIPVIHLT